MMFFTDMQVYFDIEIDGKSEGMISTVFPRLLPSKLVIGIWTARFAHRRLLLDSKWERLLVMQDGSLLVFMAQQSQRL